VHFFHYKEPVLQENIDSNKKKNVISVELEDIFKKCVIGFSFFPYSELLWDTMLVQCHFLLI